MTKAERSEFRSLLEAPENQEYLEALLGSSMDNPEIPVQPDTKKEKHIRQVLERINPGARPALNRTPSLNRSWLRYAAAATLVLGVSAYFLLTPSSKEDLANQETPAPVKNIQPGGDRAMLTLADGTEILLDSAGNGSIAEQGNTRIMKQADGQIVYGTNGSQAATSMMNTMRTPIGGKYQLTLPDGSKAWLNAASSITFPVSFPDNERSVKITGEVYLEVAPDKARPFSVSGGNAKVQVLGTSFNMNAYDDEDNLKVTLLTGGVKVSDLPSKQSVVLSRGQQAQLSTAALSTVNNVDINKVMAWKNDLFNFEDINLEDAMRQISRWYGVKVIYAQGIPKTQLWGKMNRNTSFDRLLRNLKDIGVNYTVNDSKKELTILP